MEDQFSKYLRLFGNIIFSALGLFMGFLLSLVLLRYFFGMLDQLSWFSFLFSAFIIFLPGVFFLMVFCLFFKRTLSHPSKASRIISYCLFIMAIVSWLYVLYADAVTFFKQGYTDIGKYMSYELLFLTSHVALIFLIGILQALTTNKEKDWMEKHSVGSSK